MTIKERHFLGRIPLCRERTVTGNQYLVQEIDRTPWVVTRDLFTVEGANDRVIKMRETAVTEGDIRAQRPSTLVGEEINGGSNGLEVKTGKWRKTIFRYVPK